MVFKIPPAQGQRHVTKKVEAQVREANARGLSMARVNRSNVPAGASVQWTGHVVDPAWLKANNMVETAEGTTVHRANAKAIPDWRELLANELEERLHEPFDPNQTQPKSSKPATLWEPLMCDFMEGVAYIIDRILMEPEFRAKIQVTPGGKVDPQPVIGVRELRDAMAPELNTLLKSVQDTITEGVDKYRSAIDTELDTMVIRSVWEHDIKDGSSSSDVTDDEIHETALAGMDDLAFEEEAQRRGFRVTKL